MKFASIIRHKRVLADHCVFIVSSICDGWFHEERWPYLRELYKMFQHDSMNILPDMNRFAADIFQQLNRRVRISLMTYVRGVRIWSSAIRSSTRLLV